MDLLLCVNMDTKLDAGRSTGLVKNNYLKGAVSLCLLSLV